MEFIKIDTIIKNRIAYINNPVIQFVYKDVAPDFTTKLFEIQFDPHLSTFERLVSIVSEFQDCWNNAENMLNDYKQKNMDNAMGKDEVIDDLGEFINTEIKKQDFLKNVVKDSFRTFDEQQKYILKKNLEDLNNCFDKYTEQINLKIESLTILESNEFFAEVLKEIENTKYWIAQTQADALISLENVISVKVESVIKDISGDSANLCEEIKLQLVGLENKFLEKKRIAYRMKLKHEEDMLLKKISEIKAKRRCVTDLVRLEQRLIRLRSDIETVNDEMDKANLHYNNEVNRIITDPLLEKDQKINFLQVVQEQYGKIKAECENNILEMERLMIEVKDSIWNEIKLLKESPSIEFEFDAYGRFFINEHGQKIYKEEDRDSEYIQDEFGTFMKIDSTLELGNKFIDVKMDDSDYLKMTIGKPLTKAIAQAIMYKPKDPIQYIGHWLLNYRKNIDYQSKKEMDRIALDAERERIACENRSIHSEKKETSPHYNLIGAESDSDLNLATYITPQVGSEIHGSSFQDEK